MSCKKCKNKHQICRLSNIGFFDVDKALKILEKFPREKHRFTKKELIVHLKRQHINPLDDHLCHIDKIIPVIVGQIEKDFRFLLDGNHRALRNYLQERPVFYYLLTEFETGTIFQEKPPKNCKYIS